MIVTILTPDEAKSARLSVSLSQSKVAKGAGISRTKLALFEVKKYLLSDEELWSIKQFYESLGYEFSSGSAVEQPTDNTGKTVKQAHSPGLRLIDGFAIPEGIEAIDAESRLTEITDNNDRVEELSMELAGVHWFTGEAKRDGVNEMLRLMSRNYLLSCQLQGHELEVDTGNSEDTEPELITNGGLLNNLIYS